MNNILVAACDPKWIISLERAELKMKLVIHMISLLIKEILLKGGWGLGFFKIALPFSTRSSEKRVIITIMVLREVLHSQFFYNIFTTNSRWLVITCSNLNLLLKVLFYPSLTTYYLGFVVKILWKCYEYSISHSIAAIWWRLRFQWEREGERELSGYS